MKKKRHYMNPDVAPAKYNAYVIRQFARITRPEAKATEASFIKFKERAIAECGFWADRKYKDMVGYYLLGPIHEAHISLRIRREVDGLRRTAIIMLISFPSTLPLKGLLARQQKDKPPRKSAIRVAAEPAPLPRQAVAVQYVHPFLMGFEPDSSIEFPNEKELAA